MTASITFEPVLSPGALLAAAILVSLAAWAYYRRRDESVTPARQMTLFALRVAALLAVVLALARPVLVVRGSSRSGNALAVVLDASGSMETRDAGWGSEVRLDAAKNALSTALPKLTGAYDIRVYTAAGDIERLRGDDVKSIVARGDAMALGDALVEAAPRTAPAAMLVLSDGASNSGRTLLEAAETLASRGVKVFVAPFGNPGAANVAVRRVIGPKVLFRGDPAAFFAEVSVTGDAGAAVALTLRDADRAVASAQAEGRGLVRLDFTPERDGDVTYTVEAAAVPGEISLADNRASRTVPVTSDKLAVLCIEREPRWEYRFLKNAMQRDRRFAVTTVLLDADAAASALEGNLAAFPSSREALFEYDCLIIGDVPPDALGAAEDNIRAFVSESGGGALFVAGPEFDPTRYLEGALAEILPADYRAGETADGDGWVVLPTKAGAANPALSLDVGLATYAGLPRIQWLVRLAPRLAATVLATAEPGGLPLVVEKAFGRGRAVIIATDELWRWRSRGGDRYLYRFWSQMVRYAGARRFAAQGAGEVTLAADEYARGGAVEATAYLEDGLGGALAARSARGWVEDDSGARAEVSFAADAAARGVYRATWTAGAPGSYRFVAEGPAGEASASFVVSGEPGEAKGPSSDHDALAALAAATGGAVLPPGTVCDILALYPPDTREVPRVRAISAAASWWFLAPVAALLCAEWYLRKRWGLM